VGFGLGHNTEAQALLVRSRNWRNVWDATATDAGFSGFVRGRARNGVFTTNAPTSTSDFYQGTSWNYSCNVPHERDALINLMGGRARFVQRLEYAFGRNSNTYVDFTNEANFQMTFLYGHAKRPYLTSYWANVLRQRYGLYSFPGDEDSGAMSSLYFFATTGIFPMSGQDLYYLHGPRVPQVDLHVAGGRTFSITAQNAGGANLYVQSATLNGQPLAVPAIRHSDILAGGTLAFIMGSSPSAWGTGQDFATPVRQDVALPVNAGWSASLGSPALSGDTTSSPTWGAGTNGAMSSAIQSGFPEVTLAQSGDSITLAANVTFNGITAAQTAPANRFAWGLFRENTPGSPNGWSGYLASNDATDASGLQKIWRKPAAGASAWHATSDATAVATYGLPVPAFADGSYKLVLTLTRNGTALDYYGALVRVSDGVLFSAFTGSDTTPATFVFNKAGLRVGDGLDADSVQVGECTVVSNSATSEPPTVALTAPTGGSVFMAPGVINLTATAGDADGTVAKVEFFNGQTKLGEAYGAPYTFTWNGAAAGSYPLTAVATDNDGRTRTSDPVVVTVVDPVLTTLLPKGSGWKYLANGSDQGTAWKEVGFDDSTWSSGPGVLGGGDTHIVTTIDIGPTGGRYMTTYFRRTFEASDIADIKRLDLNVLRDDGVVIYINGTEVARQNMPGGAVNYLTGASATIGGTDETTYFPSIASPLPGLVEGTNVIAVEVHQHDNQSSDLGFDLELIAASLASPPVVTIVATDATAGEKGADQTLAFTVTRTASTAADLVVPVTASGTATAGADYSGLGATITIPAGSASAVLPLTVLPDLLAEGPETVILTLGSSGAFQVGTPSSATAVIQDAPAQGFYLANIADGTKRGPMDDADGDGVANVLEYFMGTLPGDATSHAAVSVSSSDGNQFKVRYTRALNHADVTGVLNWSTDLEHWFASGQSDAGKTVTFAEAVISPEGANPETVEVTATVSGDGCSKGMFVRLGAH